jgi:hypothetical protein
MSSSEEERKASIEVFAYELWCFVRNNLDAGIHPCDVANVTMQVARALAIEADLWSQKRKYSWRVLGVLDPIEGGWYTTAEEALRSAQKTIQGKFCQGVGQKGVYEFTIFEEDAELGFEHFHELHSITVYGKSCDKIDQRARSTCGRIQEGTMRTKGGAA